jgi:multicomponent Na+:H+ antiporter subunit E
MSASSQRRVLVVAGLVVVWVLGWGEVSLANVASGIVVAVVALVVFPLDDLPGSGRPRLRLLPLARLVAFFLWELVVSNVGMARDLLGARGRIRTGVIAYRLRVESDPLLTSLANVTALTPGAMPIEVVKGPCTIYVHVTRMHERDRTVRNLARYEELFVQSFGSDEQRARFAAAASEAAP